MTKYFFIFITILSSVTWASEKTFDLEAEVSATLENIEKLKLEKVKVEKSLTELKQAYQEKQRQFVIKIQDHKKIKKLDWLRIFTEAENPEVLDRNVFVFSKLSKADLLLAKEMVQTKKQIEQLSLRLNDQMTSLQSSLEKSIFKLQMALNESEKNDQKLAQDTKSPSLIQDKGKLQTPLDSTPHISFGNSIDPLGQYLFVSKGLVYLSKATQNVLAVSRGQVIFRDVIPDWNETLIVKHDGHYYSVYAGLLQNKVQLGQLVARGEVLGSAREGELYFELRHFQNAINPSSWFQEEK